MIAWFRRRSKAYKVLAALGAASAVLLAFVPLFNLIGYESAAFYGVFFGLTVSYLSFEDLTWRGWFAGFGERLALAIAPFIVLTLNALFVKNCAYFVGVEFWLLIVVPSIAVSTTLGWVVRSAIVRRRVGHAAIALASLGSIADFGLRLAFEPPIVGHHWFLGYFSGSIYDEALTLPMSLVAYRAIQLCAIAAVLLAGTWWRDRRRSLALFAVAAVLTTVVAFAERQRFGVDLDRAHIVDELGGRVESEHFVIHYAAVPPLSDDIARLVEDHEFRYAEMMAYFGTDPVALRGSKVHSFVYANRDQKGALMGARRTLVAKIWLREIHILWRFYGDHMLAHELAHVFTEPFGTGPLRLSTRYWALTNMGLVEGVATAADWDADALDPHRASAALRRLQKAPDITALVGASGFWTQSSGRAYTLMGSFVQWLIDEHGIEKFRDAYGHGEFARVYGVPEVELVEQWGKYVDGIALDDDEIELARYFYDRKSIFEKVCARTIADLRIQAANRARARDGRAARALMEQILAFDPENAEYRVEYAQLLLALDDLDAARTQLTELLESDLDMAQRARIRALLGDVLWRSGDQPGAAARYEECLTEAMPFDERRLLLVKHHALQSAAPGSTFALHYLVDTTIADDVRVFFPAEWTKRHPDEPLADYLLGRRMWSARQWTWAEPYLRRALAVPPGPLADEAYLMLTQTLHFDHRPAEARALLDAWTPESRPYVSAKDEWMRRIDWHAGWNTVDGERR